MARTPRLAWQPEGAVINGSGPAAGEAPEIWLDPDQARHGVTVLRLKPGDRVEIAGPAGIFPARVTTAEGGRPPRLGVVPLRASPGRPAEPETGEQAGPVLALALISPPRFDWAVEKAAELGAGELWPLACERVKPGLVRASAGRAERWRRLAEEARKQCGRPRPLAVHPPATPLELIGGALKESPGFFLNPAGSPAVQGPAGTIQGPAALLVGPEGGFSPREEAAFLAAGFRPWRLGGLILRSETAALAALAVLLYRNHQAQPA